MRIVWLTDVQVPYREPMWRALQALCDLEVAFCFAEWKEGRWTWRDDDGYRSSVVPSWSLKLPRPVIRRLDEEVAVLRPGAAAALLAGADVLIIQVWWQPANLWAIVQARRRHIPYIIYAESTLESRRQRRGVFAWLRSRVFSNAGAVVVPGGAAAEAVLDSGTPPARVVRSINSLDVESFGDQVREARSARIQHEGASEHSVHHFVFVGRLIGLKNIDSLIRAFASLDDDSTLDITGEGILEDSLRSLAQACGVADRVRFRGFLKKDEVMELLVASHTLVLPSTKEVFGFAALEAHTAGLQVIVSRLAGIAANLEGREGTWVVAPTSVGLAEAMVEAKRTWDGWNHAVDTEFASPRRAAHDIVGAASIALAREVDPGTERQVIDY